MNIKSISIKNFKSFKELSINLNPKTNVIIGENNIGKSTIFEAIILWKLCFNKILRPNKYDFYKADSANWHLAFHEISFLRIINDTDLFFSAPHILRISFCIKVNNNEHNLAFEISKPQTIKNSYLRYKTVNHKEFVLFASDLRLERIKLTDAIYVYQTKPIANIIKNEPFMNKGQILKKISLGKSTEILRNKIIVKNEDEIKKLEQRVSNVMGYNVNFVFENKSEKDTDEYILLNCKNNGREQDLHMQGSGLLQVTEIFSTIEFFNDKSINLLLIDEPDSHIHVRLQKKLLEEVKKINNIQSFIISHNDNFVSEINNGELYYLDNLAKNNSILNPLNLANYDYVRNELGGIISTLDKLNFSNIICFVEGDDDKVYIDNLVSKYSNIYDKKISNSPIFIHLRGKGDILKKIDYYKRIFSQIVSNKTYILICDKDFCTITESVNFECKLSKKLGTNSKIHRHDGYCIESVLFADTQLLKHLLHHLTMVDNDIILAFITEYNNNLSSDFKDATSSRYQETEKSFLGQKNPERIELVNVNFSDYIRCSLNEPIKYQFFFNKNEITKFIKEFELLFEVPIVDVSTDSSPEHYSSSLLNMYINKIDTIGFYPQFKDLLESIYVFK